MTLEGLAAFAVANNNKNAAPKVKIYDLEIEDARAKVTVRDGNKVAKADGSQALVLGFGRKTLSLAAIAANATRVNATADKVEDFTTQLKAGIAAGMFDEAINTAQEELKAVVVLPPVILDSSNVPEDNSAPEEQNAPVGVDLSKL